MFILDQTDFSIIIPTRDRQHQLAACLKAIAHLTYPRSRFEVIIVDDGSKTSLEALIDPFRDLLDLTLLTQHTAGPASARNRGAARARGRFLAFTDDDCAPAKTWLQALAEQFAEVPDHLIGGRTLNALPRNPYSTASQAVISYLYTYYNKDLNCARFFAANNIAVPAASFHAIGGFDTIYTRAAAEDREFCDRWLYSGYRMSYAPDALVYHAHALTFRTYCQQHFNYGRGADQFHVARAQRDKGRIKLEPFSFYVDLLSYPFGHRMGQCSFSLLTLLLTSQLAHGLGYVCERFGRYVASRQ